MMKGKHYGWYPVDLISERVPSFLPFPHSTPSAYLRLPLGNGKPSLVLGLNSGLSPRFLRFSVKYLFGYGWIGGPPRK
jgi:hypothetical protein